MPTDVVADVEVGRLYPARLGSRGVYALRRSRIARKALHHVGAKGV
jgi:hypothetical protein